MDYNDILQLLLNYNKVHTEDNWDAASAITDGIIQVHEPFAKLKSEVDALSKETKEIEDEKFKNSEQAELIGKHGALKSENKSLEAEYVKKIDKNMKITERIKTLQTEIEPLKTFVSEMEKEESQYKNEIQKRKEESEKREQEYDSVSSVLNDLNLQSSQLKLEEEKLLSKLKILLEREIEIRNSLFAIQPKEKQEYKDYSKFNAVIPEKRKKPRKSLGDTLEDENLIDDSFVHVNVNLFEKLKQSNKEKITASPISYLTFAHTNPFIAIGTQDGVVSITRTDNFRENAKFTDTTRSIMSMSFSPSDILFLTASYDTVIRFYRVPNFNLVNNIRDNRDCVNDAKFLNDEKIVSCCRDQTVKMYDIKKSSPISSFTSKSKPYSLCFYQTQVITSHHDGKLRIWDARSPAPPIEVKVHKSSAIRVVNIEHTSKVVSVGADRNVVVNDIRNLKDPLVGSVNVSRSGIPAEYIQMGVTEDSVFLGGSDGQIYDYSLDSYKFKNSKKGHDAPVICVDLKPSQGMLVSGDKSGYVVFWKKDLTLI